MMWAIRRWPSSIRWVVANCAPRKSSLATTSTVGSERFAGAGDDGRYRTSQTVDLVDGRPGGCAHQHEAVHPQVGERLDGVGFGATVGEERAKPVFVQHRAQPVEEFDVPGVGQVVDDDADRPGAPLGEAARHRVGPVSELGDGLEHGLPLLVAHMRRVLQHQRHQRLRHPCPGGDGTDRRGTVAERRQPRLSRPLSSSPRFGPRRSLRPARQQRTGDHLDKSN